MPNWGEVLNEIQEVKPASPVDLVRRKYLSELHQYTKRNVIAYYSGWLQKPNIDGIYINDDDKNGFMSAIHRMECEKGLDLILHTPGGDVAATESIIDYLHRKFNDNLRVIIPQIAMSAGTMIACSGKSILMGKQSNLGPTDPYIKNVAAQGVIDEFLRAHKELVDDPSKLVVWQFILQRYHPTFLSECEHVIKLSKELVLSNLRDVMFKNQKDANKKAQEIVEYLTAYKDRKTHSRHISIDECKKIGLIVEDLEEDQKLQDLILTVHHCFMHTLANTEAFKIIENQMGAAMVRIQVRVPVGH